MISNNAYAYRFGNFDLKPRIDVEEIFDDNITYVKDNTKFDFITVPAAGLDIDYDGKNSSADFTGKVNQQIFAINNKFNNTSIEADLDFSMELSKYDRIYLRDDFIHAEEPRSFEDTFGRQAGRYSYYRNRLDVEYERDITKQFMVKLKYDGEIDIFSRKDMEDSYQNRGGVELDYIISSATLVLLSYDFTRRDFVDGENSHAHTIAAGFRQDITKQLYFDCKAGVDIIDSYDDKDHVKALVYTALTGDLDRATRVVFSFIKKTYSNAYIEDFFDFWQISATLSKNITDRLEGSFQCFYGSGEYITVDATNDLFGIKAGLEYDFSDDVQGIFSYTYSKFDSNRELQEYGKNTAILGIKAAF